jgi:hypothetical protein
MNPRRVLLGIALSLAIASPARAQSKTGTTVGDFITIEPSARVAGMGNAGVAFCEDLDAVYFNPAAIGMLNQMSVSFTHSAWLAGISFDYGAGLLPLGGFGNAFASVTALHSGDMDVRTVDQPLGTGERFNVSDVAIGLGYGRQVTARFAVGAQINYLQETIFHSSLGTATFNVGTIYRISKNGLHIGSSISNWGTQAGYAGRDLRVTYDASPSTYGDNGALPANAFTGDFSLPVLFRVGVGMPWQMNKQTRLEWEVDAFHPSNDLESASAGAELTLRNTLSLRAGYQNAFLADSELGWTLGAGIKGRLEESDFRFDYAWTDEGRLGSAHRLGLALLF